MISTTTNRNTYVGTGTTGPFTYSFRILATADLIVTKRSVANAETTLASGTDYTLSAGVNVGDPTGSITLTVALATNETLTIRRSPSLQQPTSLANQATYFGQTHETEFDRIVMQLQALDDAVRGAFRLIETLDPAAAYALRVRPETGKVLAWQSPTQLGNSTLDSSSVALPGNGRTVATLSAYLLNNAAANVMDYGAVGDGVTDDKAKFDAALAVNSVVYVPPGRVFALALPVTIGPGKTLLLAGQLIRKTAAVSTRPVLILQGTDCALVGIGTNAYIKSENASPEGVVLVGSESPTTAPSLTMVRPVINGIRIAGNGTGTAKGLSLQSTEFYAGGALYDGHFDNIHITDCNANLYLNVLCNGHTFSNFTYRTAGQYAVQLDGAASSISDNHFSGHFVNSSGAITACFKGVNVLHSSFVNMGGEPGAGKLVDFTGGSSVVFIGFDGCPGASTWTPATSVLILNGTITASAVNWGPLALISQNTSSSATTGANGAPPAQVSGYLNVSINGGNYRLPYYNP